MRRAEVLLDDQRDRTAQSRLAGRNRRHDAGRGVRQRPLLHDVFHLRTEAVPGGRHFPDDHDHFGRQTGDQARDPDPQEPRHALERLDRPRVSRVGQSKQILELHRAGKIRILAVNAAERLSAAPDIPTAIEEGVPGMIGLLFLGLFAPAATPRPIVDRIAAASRAVMADSEFQKVLIAQGLEAIPDSDSEKAKLFMDEEIARWAKIVKASGARAD